MRKIITSIGRVFLYCLTSRKFLGITYISLIPLFAAIYSTIMPDDFYHSTIKYELEAQNLKDNLEKSLKEISNSGEFGFSARDMLDDDGIVNFTLTEKLREEYLAGPANFEYSKYSLSILSVDDNILNFQIQYPFGTYDRPKPKNPEYCCFVDKLPGLENFRVPTMDCFTSPELVVRKDLTGNKIPPYLAMACRPLDKSIQFELNNLGQTIVPWGNIFLKTGMFTGLPSGYEQLVLGGINENQEDDLTAYIRLHDGLNTELEGGFTRMLYFSAVTITTLGYGDIVPITNRARMVIALESVLGIIIIGLFVSSLSRTSK